MWLTSSGGNRKKAIDVIVNHIEEMFYPQFGKLEKRAGRTFLGLAHSAGSASG